MSLSTLARRPASIIRPEAAPGAPGPGPAPAPAPRDNFDALTRYIPTETITIFVAAMSAQAALPKGITPWTLYTISAVLTPLIFWAIAFGRHRQANDGTRFRF